METPSVGVPMSVWRVARVFAVFVLLLVCVGCGDQFRPVATPITPPPPDPQPTHFIFVLNGNGANDPGTGTRIDVSGDTNVGVATVGLGPVHAALLPNGSRIYVANSLEDTISSYALTSLTPVTTSLPFGSRPVFVHTTENGAMYVANVGSTSTVPPTPPSVSAISATNNAVINNVTLPFSPIALAETPDGKKIYAVGSDGSGVGWVVSINSLDKSLNEAITGLSAPLWVATRSDSQRAYVLNSGSGTVSTIDTFSDTMLRTVRHQHDEQHGRQHNRAGIYRSSFGRANNCSADCVGRNRMQLCSPCLPRNRAVHHKRRIPPLSGKLFG